MAANSVSHKYLICSTFLETLTAHYTLRQYCVAECSCVLHGSPVATVGKCKVDGVPPTSAQAQREAHNCACESKCVVMRYGFVQKKPSPSVFDTKSNRDDCWTISLTSMISISKVVTLAFSVAHERMAFSKWHHTPVASTGQSRPIERGTSAPILQPTNVTCSNPKLVQSFTFNVFFKRLYISSSRLYFTSLSCPQGSVREKWDPVSSVTQDETGFYKIPIKMCFWNTASPFVQVVGRLSCALKPLQIF